MLKKEIQAQIWTIKLFFLGDPYKVTIYGVALIFKHVSYVFYTLIG